MIKTPNQLAESKCPDKKSRRINQRLSKKIILENLKKEEKNNTSKSKKKKFHYQKRVRKEYNKKEVCPKFK